MLNIEPKFTATQEIAIEFLFDKETKEVLFGGAAGGGKSFLGCCYILLMALKYPGTRYLMGRSKLDALKKSTLNTFFEVCQQWGLKANKHYTFNGSSNIITFYNGSEILLKDLFLFPADPNFDSLGSTEFTAAFIDEASQVTEKAKNIVASRLRYKLDKFKLIPKLLLTCNPAKNWVYTEYYRPFKDNKLKPYRKFIQSLVGDNEFISKHYELQLSQLDELSKQRLLYGNWEYDIHNDSLVDYDAILNIFDTRGVDGDKYITCDVARFGADKTVIMLWQGLHILSIQYFLKNDIPLIVDAIKELQSEHAVKLPNIILDEDGVGGGAKDYLRCIGFTNNARPLQANGAPQNYQNLKTQCYYKLADYINTGQIGVSCTDINVKKDIIEECEQIRRKDGDKDGKLKIIPKEDVKLTIGRSPDYSDAMAMRMYYEIEPNYGKYFVQ